MADGSMETPEIAYTLMECSLGCMLVAGTTRGVCHVAFADAGEPLLGGLTARFPFAAPERDDARLKPWAERLAGYVDGHAAALDVPLDVGGTRFQREVWAALRRIPRGQTRSYGQIAREIGVARGARAVARACAANPIAVAIPCHRGVPSDGTVGGYAWGSDRKRALLAREADAGRTEPPCQR